jgi:hypothetical protein
MIGLLGGALLGAIIGRFFKVLVLIPVCVVAIALYSLASVSLLILSLEFGYFIGLLSTEISAAAHRRKMTFLRIVVLL